MTTASKQAYEDILPKVGTIKRRILNQIQRSLSYSRQGLTTIPYIQQENGISYSTATARVSELYDEGLIFASGTHDGYTIWLVTPHESVEAIKRHRRIEKYKAWKKKGEEFKDLIEAGL